VKLEKVAPGIFVLLWSTGFIVARYGTRDAGPFTFLSVRMIVSAAVLWVIADVIRAPVIERRHVSSSAIVGVFMHATYLGGTFYAISRGLPSGVSALIAGPHPVVTSFVGQWLLKERLRPIQWVGIACGVVGVVAVLIERSSVKSAGITTTTVIAMVVAVVGMSTGTVV
jgi:drug/metabolite transporter (DMT)-like permease